MPTATTLTDITRLMTMATLIRIHTTMDTGAHPSTSDGAAVGVAIGAEVGAVAVTGAEAEAIGAVAVMGAAVTAVIIDDDAMFAHVMN